MSVLVCGLATMKTDPPWPPSPPLGPPRGTNFSRRNARHPRPPSPAATWILTSSTNIAIWQPGQSSGQSRTQGPVYPITKFTLLERPNADHATVGAVILELHASR